MACGVPVLATEVAGVPEAVVDGDTGSLVDPDDFDAFVDALRLATDSALRRRYGAAAVARSRALFSMEANATAISEIYRQVTAERSHAARPDQFVRLNVLRNQEGRWDSLAPLRFGPLR